MNTLTARSKSVPCFSRRSPLRSALGWNSPVWRQCGAELAAGCQWRADCCLLFCWSVESRRVSNGHTPSPSREEVNTHTHTGTSPAVSSPPVQFVTCRIERTEPGNGKHEMDVQRGSLVGWGGRREVLLTWRCHKNVYADLFLEWNLCVLSVGGTNCGVVLIKCFSRTRRAHSVACPPGFCLERRLCF